MTNTDFRRVTGERAGARRGSALLIVLGMLSFIVVSAVAFSAYMRYARMPSSYLRRSSSSRLLVKAAMAEAISCVDTSVGNDRFPGYSCQDQERFQKDYWRIDDKKATRGVVDYWQDRFYIGTNALCSAADTVSTLCVEGLAYLPPSIINEARYYSRRSIAGMWHTMGFDSGRFAFTAIDVSDFFDVNRMRANPSDVHGDLIYGRNSSDSGRVTLAYIFENSAHTGFGSICTPDQWDEFMDNYIDPKNSAKVPLISLADLNLAMNKRGLTQLSPFCSFIQNGQSFVQNDMGDDASLFRHMNFITDSWYAMTNREASAVDISRRKDQPFGGYEKGASLMQVLNDINNNYWKNLERKNSPLFNQGEAVQLYDYLDEDSVPLSLALPTVERTPMITGFSLDGELHVVLEPHENAYEKESADGKTKYVVSTYTLKLAGTLDVNAGAVYPFKYDHGASGSYQAEAAATIAFVPACEPEKGYLRCQGAVAPGVITLNGGTWSDVQQNWTMANYQGDKPSVARCRSQAKSISLPSKVNREEDAVLEDLQIQFGSLNDVTFAAPLPAGEIYNADSCTFRKCKRWIKQIVNGNEQWIEDPTFQDPTPIEQRLGFLPVQRDLSGAIAAGAFGDTTYIPTVQVWVRIFKGNDTVDLVPACWKDDKSPCDLLGSDARGASHYPLMRFRNSAVDAAGVKLANDELTLVGSGNVDIYPKAYMISDPRFNFAPENFSIADIGDTFKNSWLTEARQHAKTTNRDGDIFMACSDAGYLQSAYELAYILQISGGSDGFGAATGDNYNGSARQNINSAAAERAMWRTYSQVKYDDIDDLDIINGSQGFRVSPYTASTEIMMSALANTPLDWWAASTNDTVNNVVHGSASSAQKYSFSEMPGATVKLRYENLEDIADRMRSSFRSKNAGDWRVKFDDLGWESGGTDSEADSQSLCGVTLDNNVKLHSVDRKFLHGFWKECFGSRQQLFLIFVRAEPMMMGGGGLGQTPPQLGARAVALVWRDPNETRVDVSNGGSNQHRPHRTRILFYRQFD